MKKITLILIALVALISAANAQSAKFDGYWLGAVPTTQGEGKKITIILKISNGTAQEISWDSDAKKFTTESFAKEQTTYVRNNMLFSWLNTGGIWSETQTFSLSYVNSKTLRVIWVRQVNNAKESEDNNEWYIVGRGDLTYYSSAQFAALEKKWATE